MRQLSFFIALLWLPNAVLAQNDDLITPEDEVRNVVIELFKGMRLGDSSIVHKTFTEKGRLVTSYVTREGDPATEEITLDEFLLAIGHPHTEVWNEVPEEIKVQIDDNLATAWVPYSFYVDDRFSHCGVDAFQLVRVGTEWKILNLTDTRRTTHCDQ
jgi:hypothetical protein